MNLKLQTIHYILIFFVLVVILVLCSTNKNETFYPGTEQDWPFLPPKRWKKRNYIHWRPWGFYDSHYKPPHFASKWNPRWDAENQYHTAVPSVTNYHTDNYVHFGDPMKYQSPNGSTEPIVPTENVVPEQIQSQFPLSEEQNEFDDIAQEEVVTVPIEIQKNVEGFNNVNMNMIMNIIIILLVVFGLYWFMTNMNTQINTITTM